jgi:hypothetical protein
MTEAKVTNPKTVLGSIPGEDAFVARKLSTMEERDPDQICFYRQGDYRTEGHKPENCPEMSPGEDVGFRINNFFNDAYRMVRLMISFRAIKTEM